MNYGERMKIIRENNKLLQKDIANILNISPITYSHYETEDATIPTKHLINFCDYFNISIDYILGFTILNNYENNIKGIDKIKSGNRLKEFRQKYKLTQNKLANTLNTVQQVIQKYEKGINIIASPFLYEICKKYKISADYLLGKIDNNKDL